MAIADQLLALLKDQGASDAEEQGLLEAPIVDVERIHEGEQGANDTWLITFGGVGDQGYYKPINGVNGTLAALFGLATWEVALCEATAWRVAASLGEPWSDLIPPCVVRAIDEVDPRAPGSLVAQRFGDRERSLQALLFEPQNCLRCAFFDALIGNMDRRLANVLYEPSRADLAFIDHGFAFPSPSGTMSHSDLLDWRHRVGLDGLEAREREALDKLIESSDRLGVGRYLGDERAEAMIARAKVMQARDRVIRSDEVLP